MISEVRNNFGIGLPMYIWQNSHHRKRVKIHRTKMSCLNASTNQQQRTVQACKTSENQSQVQNYSAEEIHAEKSGEKFRHVINAKRQRNNFPPASAKEQWEALDSKIVLQLDKLIGKSTWSANLPLLVTLSTKRV